MRDGSDPMAICGGWGEGGRERPQPGPSDQWPLGDNLVD